MVHTYKFDLFTAKHEQEEYDAGDGERERVVIERVNGHTYTCAYVRTRAYANIAVFYNWQQGDWEFIVKQLQRLVVLLVLPTKH